MNKIISSAAKIVFILMAIAAVVGFFLGRLSEGNFMILCGGAFTFYFAHKGEQAPGDQPFAGK